MVRLGQGSYVAFGIRALTSPNDYLNYDLVNTDMKLWFKAQENTDNIQMERDVVRFPQVTDYDHDIDSAIEGQQRVTGSIVFQTTYSYLQDILRIVTGHNVARTGNDTYSFVPVEPNDGDHYLFGNTQRTLGIEVYRNDATDSVFYQGCMVTSWSMRFEPSGFVEVTLEFLGRGITVSAKSASPTFKSNYLKTPTGQTGTFLALNTGSGLTDYICSSATLTVNQPLEHRYDVADTAPSVIPLQSGKREVTLEAEIEAPDDDTNWMAIAQNPITNRVQQARLLLQDAVSSPSKILTVNVYNGTFNPPIEPRVAGIGVLKVSFSLTGHKDTTNKAVEVSLQLDGEATSPADEYYMAPLTGS